MRKLSDHIVEGDAANHQLDIQVVDEPGQGGANHEYSITWNPKADPRIVETRQVFVQFQNGPIKEFGVNGVTQEALLAIVIDRLRSFQAGPFASAFNASALAHCEKALSDLQTRTRERIKRGVEGTHVK